MSNVLTLGFCPMGNGRAIKPFDEIFDRAQDISYSMANVDAVIFWGGTDIHPSLYGEGLHPNSEASRMKSARDAFEWRAMHHCRINKIPMIGVCRGAQLMCAFAGGKVIQHVTGHQRSHTITTNTGEIMETTSAHHQMMYPFDVPHELLAWSTTDLSSMYHNGQSQDYDMKELVEPEVVYFPTINGLAIQGHPEWAVNTPFADYCVELVMDMLYEEEVAL